MMSRSEKYFFIIFPSYLTGLIPFFLITGPFLPDLAITLCAVIFLINSYKNSLTHYYKNFFFLAFVMFWILLLISSLNSDLILISLNTSIFYIRFGIFALSTWYLFKTDEKIILYLFYCFLFCFLSLILDAFLQFFTGKNIQGYLIQGTRISSFFGNELILGSYLSRLMPVFLASIIYLIKKKIISTNYFFFYGLIFILVDVLIYISGERTSFFYLNFSTFLLLILLNDYKKFRLTTYLISLILIILVSVSKPEYKNRMINNTIENSFLKNFFSSHELSSNTLFTSEHDALYRSAYKMFLENKYLGVGPKLFRYECSKKEFYTSIFSCSTHPHNTYIQLLAETGVAGFLMFFFIFLLICYYLIKHLFFRLFKKIVIFNNFQIVLFCSLIITLWPLVPNGNLFNNWLNVIYFLPVGFLIATFDNDKRSM
jgi:O-antigen ligase